LPPSGSGGSGDTFLRLFLVLLAQTVRSLRVHGEAECIVTAGRGRAATTDILESAVRKCGSAATTDALFEARQAAGTGLDWAFLDRWAAEWEIDDRLEPYQARYRSP
jgi:hypothetical protein